MSRVKKWLSNSLLIQQLTPKPREAKPTELFPGVEKPTVTLCYMLVAEMLQNLNTKLTTRHDYGGYGDTYYDYTFPKFQLTVTHRYGRNNKYQVFVAGSELNLSELEHKIIADGWEKFNSLRAERRKAKEESDRQDNAVMMIANFFKTEDKEDVHQVRAGDGHAT